LHAQKDLHGDGKMPCVHATIHSLFRNRFVLNAKRQWTRRPS